MELFSIRIQRTFQLVSTRHIETGTRTRWKTGPGNQGNQPGKGTGSIRRKKLDTYSVPDGTEYIKRKKEYDCNID